MLEFSQVQNLICPKGLVIHMNKKKKKEADQILEVQQGKEKTNFLFNLRERLLKVDTWCN